MVPELPGNPAPSTDTRYQTGLAPLISRKHLHPDPPLAIFPANKTISFLCIEKFSHGNFFTIEKFENDKLLVEHNGKGKFFGMNRKIISPIFQCVKVRGKFPIGKIQLNEMLVGY